MGFYSASMVHVMVEAMRHAYFDRNTYLGDPEFVTNPLARLLSSDHATAIRAHIGDKATPSDTLASGRPPHERMETTHYSVMDHAGNAVAVTYTLNGFFGAGVMAGDTGFLLNNEMDDFTAKPEVANRVCGLVQGEANTIAPGKRPLSSMALPSCCATATYFWFWVRQAATHHHDHSETALNILDFGMTPQEAVDGPHLHHQWQPDEVVMERSALSVDTQARLRDMGYRIRELNRWGATELFKVGHHKRKPAKCRQGDGEATRNAHSESSYGASDTRRPAGAAIGY